MQMTSEEIVRDYNSAANKSKQIKILADLNVVSPSEIRNVLALAGVADVKPPKRVRKRITEPPASCGASGPVSDPDMLTGERIPAPEIYGQIETILAVLPANASETVRRGAGDFLSGLFEEYLFRRLGLSEERLE